MPNVTSIGVRRFFLVRRASWFVPLCMAIAGGPVPDAMARVQRRYDPRDDVTVTVALDSIVGTFRTDEALGAGIDGMGSGRVAETFIPARLRAMQSTGLRALTYRLRTELGIATWHWNPSGTWSDAAHRQGYWVSSDRPGAPIRVSYGYRLPRRGNTVDQANNDGYSRIDDGNVGTFWKSNPYLDARFTRDADSLHSQWVVVDLGNARLIDGVRIDWGHPFAMRFDVQWWDGAGIDSPGQWRTFPEGRVTNGTGGSEFIRLNAHPAAVRYVRLRLLKSSHTAEPAARDLRDSLGYAIRELHVGSVDAKGRLVDVVRHAVSSQSQSTIWVSSTDPWHRASDRDPEIEQPGLDLVFESGLTSGLPMLTPVGLLYDTPENGVAELRYLRARHYAVDHIEMGEEPDGQSVAPEDYAALFVQWAARLHAVDPSVVLGGPGFESAVGEVSPWLDRAEDPSWMRRFTTYLRGHGRLDDFGFYSFEWYPFDSICGRTGPHVLRGGALLEAALDSLRHDGLSERIPWIMTEYGYSAFAGQPEVDIAGALVNADIVGTFLSKGGSRAYLYGYEPNSLLRNQRCESWGNNTLFIEDDNGSRLTQTATYHGARLLATEWARPGHDMQQVIRTSVAPRAFTFVASYESTQFVRGGEHAYQGAMVSAYSLRRSDGTLAIALINKDSTRAHRVHVRFTSQGRMRSNRFVGPVDLYQFSAEEYRWTAAGSRGHPARSASPAHARFKSSPADFELPPYSIVVIRGLEPS